MATPAKLNLEVIGLRAEIIGLVTLFLAAVWQTSVTDWLDAFPARSQYFIQETANLAVLQALSRMSLASNEDDSHRRTAYLNEADDITRQAMSRLVEIRNRTEAVEKTQTSWLKRVRHSLFALGALLIILGKSLVLRHKQSIASKASTGAQATPP